MAWQSISIPITIKPLVDGIVDEKTPDGSFSVDYPIKEGFYGYGDRNWLPGQELIQGRRRDIQLLERRGIDAPGIDTSSFKKPDIQATTRRRWLLW